MAVHGHCMPALLLILIHIMPVADSFETITGFVGYNVTLPYSYDAQYYKLLHVCWGRGKIGAFYCIDEIIASDGFKVTRRKSPRYQLSGDLNQGDVSLTIIDAVMGDSGIYGCSVATQGRNWHLNHLEKQVTLIIKNIRETTVSATDAASPATPTFTRGQDGNNSTGSPTANTPQVSGHVDRSFLIRASVILLLLLLVQVSGHWLHKRKQQREVRTLAAVEHQTDVSVHYGNLGAHTGLHQRDGQVEDI